MARQWEPYFRPTTRVHDSGFRCFECGYLQIGDDKKAKRKVIIGTNVDHISNWLFSLSDEGRRFDMDLLRDGNIRIFNHKQKLFWSLPGWSDAEIVDCEDHAYPDYAELDKIYERQKETTK